SALSKRHAQTLLDLRLAIFDVLFRDRIVFFLGELVGHRARVLLGHIVVAGVGARNELDLQTDGFGHWLSSNLTGPGKAAAFGAEPSGGRANVKKARFFWLLQQFPME